MSSPVNSETLEKPMMSNGVPSGGHPIPQPLPLPLPLPLSVPVPVPVPCPTGSNGITTTIIMARVKAQVMRRDDSTGGWIPIRGGGLSNVLLVRRTIEPSEPLPPPLPPPLPVPGQGLQGGCQPMRTTTNEKHEYIIIGKRISDQSVVLFCTIKRNFVYNKVMPTFHHWMSGNSKYGLTFMTATEGRQFDEAIKEATNDLLQDGSLACQPEGDEEDIFMTLELPLESRSSSSSSSNSNSLKHSSHNNFHRINFKDRETRDGHVIDRHDKRSTMVTTPPLSLKDTEHSLDKIEIISDYVQFAKPTSSNATHPHQVHPQTHDYSYPYSYPTMIVTRDCASSIAATGKKGNNPFPGPLPQPLLPTKKKRKTRLWSKKERRDSRKGTAGAGGGGAGGGATGGQQQPYCYQQCRYCLEYYHPLGPPLGSSPRDKSRGESSYDDCEYAPDSLLTCINTLTCIGCAHCVLYHCVDKDEEDGGNLPSSNSPDDSLWCGGCAPPTPHHPQYQHQKRRCKKRWTALTILSFFVPCLWCYPPLKACHQAAKSRKCCFSWPCCCCLSSCVGGHHQPSDQS